ncbi:DUF4177 domain-containing protein [Candidatus Electronema sp. JM]|uniref:DUF4177 domain-containing protein n=1 Tax=Candidatus Electronema sp. JM TaxID=3401571 RepID=UPI003AA8C970
MTARWQYKTLLVEFQKDGILGEKYIDEEETDTLLNEEGRNGWELVTAALVPEGMMFFCKRELLPGQEEKEEEAEDAETVEIEELPDSVPLGDIRIF